MAQDHNDIYSIVERLRVLEEGLDKNQKSVNQLGATFKPKTVAVLTAKQDPKNPMAGKLVGGCEESVANEDVLDKVKKSLADYLSNVADEIKQDTDLKDKKKEDSDLKKKDSTDRDLVAKDLDEDHRKLAVGDPVTVIAPNEFEGKTGEIAEFSPSGKFVVVNLYNHGEHSMHLSDVEYNEYADDQEAEEDDWYDEVNEDPTEEEPATDAVSSIPSTNPTLPESALVKTVTNECGLFEIHGNEPSGFEIRCGKNAMRSRFKSLEEAVMALEMFAARRRKADESADYIEEA